MGECADPPIILGGLVKMKIVAAVFLFVGVWCLSGCLYVATPAAGMLVTEVTWDGHAQGSLGTKEGRACAQSILGLVAQGDASIKAAAADGGITNVKSVDHYTKWLLVYGEYCTIVRGT